MHIWPQPWVGLWHCVWVDQFFHLSAHCLLRSWERLDAGSHVSPEGPNPVHLTKYSVTTFLALPLPTARLLRSSTSSTWNTSPLGTWSHFMSPDWIPCIVFTSHSDAVAVKERKTSYIANIQITLLQLHSGNNSFSHFNLIQWNMSITTT